MFKKYSFTMNFMWVFIWTLACFLSQIKYAQAIRLPDKDKKFVLACFDMLKKDDNTKELGELIEKAYKFDTKNLKTNPLLKFLEHQIYATQRNINLDLKQVADQIVLSVVRGDACTGNEHGQELAEDLRNSDRSPRVNGLIGKFSFKAFAQADLDKLDLKEATVLEADDKTIKGAQSCADYLRKGNVYKKTWQKVKAIFSLGIVPLVAKIRSNFRKKNRRELADLVQDAINLKTNKIGPQALKDSSLFKYMRDYVYPNQSIAPYSLNELADEVLKLANDRSDNGICKEKELPDGKKGLTLSEFRKKGKYRSDNLETLTDLQFSPGQLIDLYGDVRVKGLPRNVDDSGRGSQSDRIPLVSDKADADADKASSY